MKITKKQQILSFARGHNSIPRVEIKCRHLGWVRSESFSIQELNTFADAYNVAERNAGVHLHFF